MPDPVLPPAAPPVIHAATARSRRRGLQVGFGGFARLMLSRPLGFVALAGVILGALILPPTGINVATCGFHTSTGLPCVGCGLTRSVTCFLQGQFALSMAYHPFGPAFALVFVILGVSSLLPEKWRESALRRIEPWDRHLGVATIVFFALLVAYGVFRISLVSSGHPDLEWWKSSDAPPMVTRG